jgi:archaellum component FlaF (FlaF/FlaG flagellin family)
MKIKNLQRLPKNRRGLSSVVGALLFVVLMVATFAVLGVALDSQTEIVSTNREVADKGLKKQQENFVISNIEQKPGNTLEINLKNNGQNAAEIFTLIMTNSSDSANGFPTTTYEIPSNTSFLPPGTTDSTNIIETLGLEMKPASSGLDTYQFKVISSLGTIKKFNVVCDTSGLCGQSIGGGGGSSGLDMQLFLDGPNGVNTKTSTVIIFVSNTGDVPLKDVYPDDACDAMVASIVPDDAGTADFTDCLMEPLPDVSCGDGSGICLAAGQTVLFRVDGTITGEIGDVFTFCNSVSGKELDDTLVPGPTDCDLLTVIDPNDCGGCGPGGEESIILVDDLLIRPSIFMTIPSPFGDATDADDEKGLWGISVANPTDRDMTISKVTIVAYPPGGNAQDVVFSGKKGGSDECLEEDIKPGIGPSPGGYWDCPRDNTIMWQNFTSPLLLQANSTETFMVKVEPGGIFVENQNLDALIVQGNVYSSFGSFGKSGYQSTMYDDDSPIANVYLTNNADLRTGFIGNVNDIANYTSTTFNAVLADMDDNPATYINPGAKFIINIPREWTFEEFISCEGFEDSGTPAICDGPNEPTWTIHSDGSTQIIGISQGNIGDGTTPDVTDPSEARKISFKATSASVQKPQLFVMYILADGIVTTPEGDRTIGPLSEVVLNVDPPIP